jgi:hypothetical protein
MDEVLGSDKGPEEGTRIKLGWLEGKEEDSVEPLADSLEVGPEEGA